MPRQGLRSDARMRSRAESAVMLQLGITRRGARNGAGFRKRVRVSRLAVEAEPNALGSLRARVELAFRFSSETHAMPAMCGSVMRCNTNARQDREDSTRRRKRRPGE